MYKSVVEDGKFLVLIADGIFDAPIIELPSEELADQIAFELQTAWDEGVERGENQKTKELDSKGFHNQISQYRQLMKKLTQEQQDAYHQKLLRRQNRIQKVKDARRWQSVLSWKKQGECD